MSPENSRSSSEGRSSSRGSRIIFTVGEDDEGVLAGNGSAVREVSGANDSREAPPVTKLTKKQKRKEMERRRKSIGEGDGYSRAQRRKLLRRMNRVASAGKLRELPKSDKHYHATYHPGMDHSDLMRSPDSPSSTEELSDSGADRQHAHREQGGRPQQQEQGDRQQQPWQLSGSRFSVSKAAVPSFCLLGGHLASSSPVATRNMYGVLDSSLHEDPTPVKERALDYPRRGAAVACGGPKVAPEAAAVAESDGEVSRRRAPAAAETHSSTRRRIKFANGGAGAGGGGGGGSQNKRSKSSSPKRIGEAARQKQAMKRFDPGKADWIRKK